MRQPELFMLRLLCLLPLLLCTTLSAQDKDIVTKELLSVCVNGDVQGLYYQSGKKVYRLRAFQSGIGSPVLYTGPNPLFLYGKPSDLAPQPEGSPPPVPVAKVKLPSDKRTLLIFTADEKDPRKTKVVAYGASIDSLKAGDYRIYNFSKQTLLAALGDKKISIPTGKQQVLSSSSWRSEITDLEAKFGYQVDGKPKIVYSSVWGHRPQKRTFLFVFDQPGNPNRPLDLRRYYDVPGVPIPPGAAEEVSMTSSPEG